MEYEETDFTEPATKIHKVVRAKSSKKKKKKSGSVFSDLQIESYLDVVRSRLNRKALIGYSDGTKKDGSKSGSSTAGASATDASATDGSVDKPENSPTGGLNFGADCNNQQVWGGSKETDPWKDCPGRTEVTNPKPPAQPEPPTEEPTPPETSATSSEEVPDSYWDLAFPGSPDGPGPATDAYNAYVSSKGMDPDDLAAQRQYGQDNPEDQQFNRLSREEADEFAARNPRKRPAPIAGETIRMGESVFRIPSVIREEDDDYSDEEISQDKDPNAAGGPYSEDDIKVTQDPRDAAPGMDPVGDPPTQQAKQITTGLAYKAPAAAGTMQTMLPGGEHDAIQKQYPDLFENLLGCGGDMKGGFLTDPKDKKKAMAVMALMSQLDGKLKEDKKARLKKILNNNKPPAIPGSEGY